MGNAAKKLKQIVVVRHAVTATPKLSEKSRLQDIDSFTDGVILSEDLSVDCPRIPSCADKACVSGFASGCAHSNLARDEPPKPAGTQLFMLHGANARHGSGKRCGETHECTMDNHSQQRAVRNGFHPNLRCHIERRPSRPTTSCADKACVSGSASGCAHSNVAIVQHGDDPCSP